MGNWRLELTARKMKLRWGKDPEKYIPEECTITITIYDSDDATQPETQEMHERIQS